MNLRPAREALLNPKFMLAVYCVTAAVVTVFKLSGSPIEQNGFHYRPLQNFAIFRNSFEHLIHHQNIYAPFIAGQWDLFRYSPAFALLFAPFAMLPYSLGAVLWNLLNAAALFWAIHAMPGLDERRKMLVLWFIFLAMLTSVENAQSNALTAALMIGAWNFQERGKSDYAAVFIVLAALIKLFGIFAILPCLLCGDRKRLLRYLAASAAVFAALPLFVLRYGELILLYRNWYATVAAFNHARLGISFMGLLKAWLHLDLPANYVVAAAAIVLVTTAVIGRHRQVLVLASVLIFVTIFNYAAESPSYVIAVSGVALWFFAQRPTPVNLTLLIATFLFAMLSSTDLFPRTLRHQILEPYVVKALPCVLVWFKLQFDLIRDNRVMLKDTHATGSR